jgi:hypothetical protein
MGLSGVHHLEGEQVVHGVAKEDGVHIHTHDAVAERENIQYELQLVQLRHYVPCIPLRPSRHLTRRSKYAWTTGLNITKKIFKTALSEK